GEDRQLRHRGHGGFPRAPGAHHRDRREAAARRCAQHAGRGRPLRAHAAHLRAAGVDRGGRRRRDPADRCDCPAAAGTAGGCLPLPRHALRLRHPHRPGGGDDPLRAGPREAERSGQAADAGCAEGTRRQGARVAPRASARGDAWRARQEWASRRCAATSPPARGGEDSPGSYRASKIPAAPIPVPMHIVTMPYFCWRRRRPWTRVAVRTAPVAPSGCPSAIAPPSGLTLSGSRPTSRITASAWAAKASLSSIQSSWSWRNPACSSAFGVAATGPMPITSGRTPATEKLTKRASGVRPYSFTAFSDASSTAPAPSDICELLPAVTVPPNWPLRNTGRSFARPSALVSGRGPSSVSTTVFFSRTLPAPRSGIRDTTSYGLISSRNSPASIAFSAFWCEARAKASWSSRETFHSSETFSAVMPMP